MSLQRTKVLMVLEGTYPYNGGGVSTWAHMLCNKVQHVDFTLYSINANFETEYKYDLSNSVKNVIQVPLWAPYEPYDYINYGKAYYKIINRKERTKSKLISEHFIPLFKNLVYNFYQEETDLPLLNDTIYQMWLFFQKYDYKQTMRSKIVWDTFCEITVKLLSETNIENTSVNDLTVGMRWIYRFLIPLSIDVPKTDVAHITLSGFPIIPALVAKYKYNSKIITSEHGVFIRERLLAINSSDYSYFLKKLLIKFSESITKLAYFNSDKILSVNKFNMKWEKMYGADEDKIGIIYNGIDHLLFKPQQKPEHLLGIPTVVAAARIFDLKDICTMIKTCSVVKQTIPNVKFLVYGDKTAVPEYTSECEALISELALENNFILAGYHDKPHELFSEGDVSILTSISEGFPYTVLESMSCGVPVVATDVGGVSEALDENSGFICKPKDYIALGNSVIELLQNEQLRQKKGAYARQKVIDNFTINTFITKYEQEYLSISKKDKKEETIAYNALSLFKNEVKEAS
ncbi:MAG: GT4 family glycosyltransferase PelF [Flavobacteriaceae bacterium]